ncbi:MAG: lipid A biosynthesis lauroyl acyltransferase [Rhizobiales bacterium]|nr:lipid A biosynthesis lauroyl acyltransferase [Hyphomicrobiales bacterium]
MPTTTQLFALRLRRFGKRVTNAVFGWLAVGALRVARWIKADVMIDAAGWLLRKVGPLLPEHRVGRANLAAAYPEKSAAEIDGILRGVWDNLGRVGAEFAYLDRLWDFDPAQPENSRVEFTPGSEERFSQLRDDGKPALIFAAHLANWEMPALAAAAHGLDTAILYRRPNIGNVDRWVRELRSTSMGTLIPTGLDAPVKAAEALERGLHVGMLADQYARQGVDVTFFGRRTKANSFVARLARHVDCPIHGVRVIRLPGRRFRVDLTEAIEPVRDSGGQIDVPATMQVITSAIEGWVREHPEQWLWLHRRWR